MQFNIVLAIAITALAIEILPAKPVPDPELRTLLCLIIALVPVILSHLQTVQNSQLELAYEFEVDSTIPSHSMIRSQNFFELVWLFASCSILFIINWPQIVRGNFALHNTVFIDEFLIFLPIVLPLIFAWYIFSRIEVGHGHAYANLAPVSSRLEQRLIVKRLRITASKTRILLGLLLVPTLLFFVLRDLLVLIDAQFTLLATLLLLFGILAAMPMLLRVLWKIESIADSELGDRVRSIMHHSNVRIGDVCIWKTGGSIVNALVIGIVPGKRQVLISDGLLQNFEVDELEGIVRHEAAHFSRHHLRTRLLVIALPFALIYSLISMVCFLSDNVAFESISNVQLSIFWQSLLLTCAVIYAFISLCWIARKCELDADLVACCESQGDQLVLDGERLSAYMATLEKLFAIGPATSNWLYPSNKERLRLLQDYRRNPENARARSLQFKILTRVILVMTVIVPAVTSVGWICSF